MKHAELLQTLPALPKEVLAILNDGGLIPHVKKQFAKS
jgi:hypothetical protein